MIGRSSSEPELSGRWTDALFGYGLFYLLSAPLVYWFATQQELDAWPKWIATMSGLVIVGPHYGATILRAYEKRNDRHCEITDRAGHPAIIFLCHHLPR
jgi:hypothetical protein